MITILQRQNVSKRTAPSVPSRARTNGVRWSSRDLPAPRRPAADPPPVRPDRPISILSLQSPHRPGVQRHSLFLRQGGLPRREGWESHSFLRDQLVRRKNRRAQKRARVDKRVRSPLFGRLRQHAFQLHEIGGVVLGDGILNFFRKRFRIVDGRAHFGFRPTQMFGHCGQVSVIAADEQ